MAENQTATVTPKTVEGVVAELRLKISLLNEAMHAISAVNDVGAINAISPSDIPLVKLAMKAMQDAFVCSIGLVLGIENSAEAGWIHVAECLPAPSLHAPYNWVLVCSSEGPDVAALFSSKTDGPMWRNKSNYIVRVTKWMPLPKWCT